MNSGKSPGMDDVKVMSKLGKVMLAEWINRLPRLTWLCMREGRAPEYWQEVCEVPI